MIAPIDTTNKFLVSMGGDNVITFLRPLPQRISRIDALLLAAYLVTMAANTEEDWEKIRMAVESA